MFQQAYAGDAFRIVFDQIDSLVFLGAGAETSHQIQLCLIAGGNLWKAFRSIRGWNGPCGL